jgi:putative methionine-R-sulfoxide reductase with GAF domain
VQVAGACRCADGTALSSSFGGAVEKGDEIVTLDGLCGTVRQVRDTFVASDIADRMGHCSRSSR